jgi:NADH-ubiquinone oxidoreductase chain 5
MITQHPGKNVDSLFYSGLFMIVSCGIKSAQIFGHLWLPDSMEAPIPASSLIHSATLVSAGIYLILKFHIVFYYANLYNLIFFIGAVTGFYGGSVASAQTDIKKLLAYSTISHCGFIFSSLALDNFIVTIVYLYLHGLFKALTFFCAGSLVKFNNTQDMRQMGMLRSQFANTAMLIGASINLAGLPYTVGYLYKSLFLQVLMSSPYNIVSYGFLISGMLSSVVYVYKIIYYSCFDYRKGEQDILTLYIQNNTSANKYFVLFFTFSKYLAFILLYLFATFFFIIVKYFVLKNYLFIYNGETVYVNNIMFLAKYTNLQKYLVSIYYTLFLITVLILLLVS